MNRRFSATRRQSRSELIRRASVRPKLESLEGRDCPTAILAASLQGHNLTISGNEEWNVVQITQDDTSDTLTVVYGTLPRPSQSVALVVNTAVFQSSAVSRVIVDLDGGNDNFRYTLAPGTDLLNAKEVKIATGDGDDCVTIDLANSADAVAAGAELPPLIDSCDGAVTADGTVIQILELQDTSTWQPGVGGTTRTGLGVGIDTGAGNDKVSVALGALADGQRLNLSAGLGVGDDQFWLGSYTGVGAGASMTLSGDGGDGQDVMVLKSYGDIRGNLKAGVKGGAGNDTVNALLQGLLSGKATLSASGDVGNDAVSMSLQTTVANSATLNAGATGDAGDDVVTVLAGGNVSAANASLSAGGGTGSDQVFYNQAFFTLSGFEAATMLI